MLVVQFGPAFAFLGLRVARVRLLLQHLLLLMLLHFLSDLHLLKLLPQQELLRIIAQQKVIHTFVQPLQSSNRGKVRVVADLSDAGIVLEILMLEIAQMDDSEGLFA